MERCVLHAPSVLWRQLQGSLSQQGHSHGLQGLVPLPCSSPSCINAQRERRCGLLPCLFSHSPRAGPQPRKLPSHWPKLSPKFILESIVCKGNGTTLVSRFTPQRAGLLPSCRWNALPKVWRAGQKHRGGSKEEEGGGHQLSQAPGSRAQKGPVPAHIALSAEFGPEQPPSLSGSCLLQLPLVLVYILCTLLGARVPAATNPDPKEGMAHGVAFSWRR